MRISHRIGCVVVVVVAAAAAAAVQPFVGPWPLFGFLTLNTVGRTPWTGDQPITKPLPS
jgi:hypothetical protein